MGSTKAGKKTTKKASKAMKAMKAKKAKKVSKIARGKRAKAAVFNGKKVKTVSGLTKNDLIKNKNGKIVSKKASQTGQKRYNKQLKSWICRCESQKGLENHRIPSGW